MTDTNDALTVLALTCSLKPSPAPSSTDLLAQQLLDALAGHGATGELVRVVDHDVRHHRRLPHPGAGRARRVEQ